MQIRPFSLCCGCAVVVFIFCSLLFLISVAAIICKCYVQTRKYAGPFINIVQGEWCYKNGGKTGRVLGRKGGLKIIKLKTCPCGLPHVLKLC